ncbi:MAG: molybdopterin-binding protein [Bacteroidales bacterium]|jgi:molybdenum cofactor synthesis domain-containing protein|nr:molybdopterin-binding protein [Bacteroidales bacterium]
MNLPQKYKILIITLSDRAFRGEYKDISGPRVSERLETFMKSEGWDYEIKNKLIPDEVIMLKELVVNASAFCDIIITTGGTGIGPRDITIDTIRPLLSKEIPGIMDQIRMKYGSVNPNALLSRSIAGVRERSLIYTLPGSVKAVDEYMNEILKTLKHTLLMQYGIDSHGKTQ